MNYLNQLTLNGFTSLRNDVDLKVELCPRLFLIRFTACFISLYSLILFILLVYLTSPQTRETQKKGFYVLQCILQTVIFNNSTCFIKIFKNKNVVYKNTLV